MKLQLRNPLNRQLKKMKRLQYKNREATLCGSLFLFVFVIFFAIVWKSIEESS